LDFGSNSVEVFNVRVHPPCGVPLQAHMGYAHAVKIVSRDAYRFEEE
jgi:hypothetical protein